MKYKGKTILIKIFKGLKEWDTQPHLLKDFTKGKRYYLFIEDGFRFSLSDTNEKIMISNNANREYFKTI